MVKNSAHVDSYETKTTTNKTAKGYKILHCIFLNRIIRHKLLTPDFYKSILSCVKGSNFKVTVPIERAFDYLINIYYLRTCYCILVLHLHFNDSECITRVISELYTQ